MKQFKFRGKTIYRERIVCGEYSTCEGEAYVGDDLVDEDSVVLFVGYDADGNELFADTRVRVFDYNRYRDGSGIEKAGDVVPVNKIGETFDNFEIA